MPPVAFALALAAIVLWSTLAALSVRLQPLQPFLLAGIGLGIGGLLSARHWRAWQLPMRERLIGLGGILGYHVLYFQALRQREAVVEANLLNYLWPLLIVLLAPLVLVGHRLEARHWLAAGAGFAGTALIVVGEGVHPSAGHLVSWICALGAAVVWALYSLLSKRLAIPTAAVGGLCVVSGAASLGISRLVEGPIGPRLAELDVVGWVCLAAIALGPLGAAFFAWDAALKRGDARLIGVLAYLTPLLSTLLLMAIGRPFHLTTVLALVLIVGGALLGTWGTWRKPVTGRITRSTTARTKRR
mgnify:CR=1 FL=1